MTEKLSSARLRTVEDTHWSVKMPTQTTVFMSMLRRISRRLVPVSAESVVLVTTISSPSGASSGTSCEACWVLGSSRLFQPGSFWLSERSRPSSLWQAMRANRHSMPRARQKASISAVRGITWPTRRSWNGVQASWRRRSSMLSMSRSGRST